MVQCVRDCQHPWFGGNGECIVGTDNAPACVCDSGFSAFDVLGQPACESKAARTTCHAGGCLLSVACFTFAARKLCATLHTSSEGGNGIGVGSSPGGAEGTMQASSLGLYTRPRIVRLFLFATILWSASVFIFHVTAWRTRLTLEILFPWMTFSVAWGSVGGLLSLRLWLFVLPSRLMRSTSVPTVIKSWSDDRHGLAIVASCYWVWIVCCGIAGRFNCLRARAMMLGSTGPMVGFYGLVVVSVSLTLSKAIRDSERSAALQMSSHSSKKGSAVATPASSYNIKRWAMACVRRDFGTGGGNGGDGADAGSGGNRGAAGNHTGNRPKANGGYAKTKSLLTKLTRASVAVMSAVMVVIVLSLHEGTIAHDTPLIFFMALFTTMPSVWLIITMRFLTREGSKSSAAAVAVAAAPSPVRFNNPTTIQTRCSPGGRLQKVAGKLTVAKRVGQRVSEKRYHVRDAPTLPVLHVHP